MGKSAPRKDGAEGASFTPQMMRDYSAGMAESAKIQAQAEADAMTIRANAEAEARRTRAAADAEATRVMREAGSPSSSFSVGGRGFKLAFKGPTLAFTAAALLAVGGVVTYQVLTQQGSTQSGNTPPGSTPSGGTAGPDRATGAPGSTASPTATGAPSPPGPAGIPASGGGTGAAAVREERKVVLRTGWSLDVDFTDAQPDITLSLPSNGDGYTLMGDHGDLASVSGDADAKSCAAATDFGFTIKEKTIRKGLTACVLTDENRVAAIRVLGWQTDSYGLSSLTLNVTTWEKTEDAA
ncbi:hypothetical protein [Streptomyces sp. S.PNR 29]|uniref:hypothetical protein n=1 Tax=Streptomyces sp. S.PNR 29 TaxID=2973805 RepID=UPI0025B0A865|nr:hypothetical protein [Streptomyces sp. S.PNR 29]MDN0200438.1 hypothetical protein [Streptomyces sp. S.PNR 29]